MCQPAVFASQNLLAAAPVVRDASTEDGCEEAMQLGGCHHSKPIPAPCVLYPGNKLQEGDLWGSIGQHQFTSHLCPVLQSNALCLSIPAQQHMAHRLDKQRKCDFSRSIPTASRLVRQPSTSRHPVPFQQRCGLPGQLLHRQWLETEPPSHQQHSPRHPAVPPAHPSHGATARTCSERNPC